MKKIIKMRKIFLIIAIIALVSTFHFYAYAHTSATGYSHDSAYTIGWDIYEDSVHSKSYNQAITVNCGAFGAANFKPYIDSAISDWNGSTFNGSKLVSMSADNSSGSVLFCSKSDAQISSIVGSGAWAFVYRSNSVKDPSNTTHYSTAANSVEIWVNWNDVLVNKAAGCSTHTALHELGHVIGLKDIPATVSYNAYLMCNEFGANYAVPKTITTSDKKGAAVILGQHTSHSFTLYNNHNASYHRTTCSVCGIYSFEAHTYSNGKCTKCGRIQ